MKLYCYQCNKDVTHKPVVIDLLCNLYCSPKCLKKSPVSDFGIEETIIANIGVSIIRDFIATLPLEERNKILNKQMEK